MASKQQLQPDLERQGVDFVAVQDQLRGLCREVLTAAGAKARPGTLTTPFSRRTGGKSAGLQTVLWSRGSGWEWGASELCFFSGAAWHAQSIFEGAH